MRDGARLYQNLGKPKPHKMRVFPGQDCRCPEPEKKTFLTPTLVVCAPQLRSSGPCRSQLQSSTKTPRRPFLIPGSSSRFVMLDLCCPTGRSALPALPPQAFCPPSAVLVTTSMRVVLTALASVSWESLGIAAQASRARRLHPTRHLVDNCALVLRPSRAGAGAPSFGRRLILRRFKMVSGARAAALKPSPRGIHRRAAPRGRRRRLVRCWSPRGARAPVTSTHPEYATQARGAVGLAVSSARVAATDARTDV